VVLIVNVDMFGIMLKEGFFEVVNVWDYIEGRVFYVGCGPKLLLLFNMLFFFCSFNLLIHADSESFHFFFSKKKKVF
jgi:hypothetical protein